MASDSMANLKAYNFSRQTVKIDDPLGENPTQVFSSTSTPAQDANQPAQPGQPEEKQDKQEEEEDKSPPEKAVNFTLGKAKSGGQAVGNGIASLPAPGDIGFPLLILLVFFFLIIPIKGRSRAMWLWEVITGGARVPTVALTPAGGGPPSEAWNHAKSGAGAGNDVANSVLLANFLASQQGLIGFGDTSL